MATDNLRHSVYGLFNDSFPPVLDGVTLAVQNYVRWLTAAGKPVTVITPWNPETPPHEDFELHRYFSLPIYNRYPYRYGYPKLDPFIWRHLRHTPFRIIHAHCPFSSGHLGLYAARYHDIPFVTTFHSKYRTDLERSLPRMMVEYQMRKLLRFYNAATEVWIPQAAVEETLREYGFKGRVTVVENGNDLADGIEDLPSYKAEARKSLGLRDDEIGLLFVGQHILEKGLKIIIKALALLGNMPFRMNFIGTGYAAGDMKRLVESLHLEDRVTFHGVITDRETLRRYYAASDLFLFPSFYDNAPLVVREAAAMGTPSILLTGSTAAEMITDGENGFLTSRTPTDYARLISAIAADRAALDRAGKGARATLCRSWQNVVGEVINRYDEIIDRYGRK